MPASPQDQLSMALTTIHEQGEAIEKLSMEKYEPIAIVGVGLRFPGGNNRLDDFSEFLRVGKSGIVPIPEERWDVAAFSSDDSEELGKIHPPGAGFLPTLHRF